MNVTKFRLDPETTVSTTTQSAALEPFSEDTAWPVVVTIFCVSLYLAAASLFYLCKKWKSGHQRKENLICFLTSINLLMSPTVALLYVLNVVDLSINSCLISLLINITILFINKYFFNAVQFMRYKKVNEIHTNLLSNNLFVATILITIVEVIHQIFMYAFILTKADVCEKKFYNLIQDTIPFTLIILHSFVNFLLQIIVIGNILKPICVHTNRLNCVQSRRIKELNQTLKRITVLYTIYMVFDLFLTITFFIRSNRKWLVTQLSFFVTTLTLILSFSDYKTRLFPFFKKKALRHSPSQEVEVNVIELGPIN